MTFVPNNCKKIILKLIYFDKIREIHKQQKLELKNASSEVKKLILKKNKNKMNELKNEFNEKINNNDDYNLL